MSTDTRSEDLLVTPPVETHLISSKHVQQTFRIQVMQPARKKGERRRYPVVYATDGNYTFEMFRAISQLIQVSEKDAPPFILVGIGYPSDSFNLGRMLRARDFTFPPLPNIGMAVIPRRYEGELRADAGAKDYYGAEDFRRFIGQELIPFIDETYQTVPGERTYFGHSGGGFFGLFTLFNEPSLFNNYIVSSPGLLFDGQFSGSEKYENRHCGAQMLSEFLASGRSLDGIKLYMVAGADEEFEPDLGAWQIVSGLYQMARMMKNAAIHGLELMTEVIPGETHMTVWPIAFTHGVQAMFGTRRIPRSVYF